MLTSGEGFFAHYFPLLTKHPPYPWQAQLFSDLTRGEVPDSLALPTGSGKTSILPIWLLALAWNAASGSRVRLPRRLAWVVNRRVVVDQATVEARDIQTILQDTADHDDGDPLVNALRQLSGTEELLAVSTLRGEHADNRDWSRNPCVPAIIIGTVDMVGSRLLFRGYGDSRYWRPLHAGLLGVDSLIVNDEAHLTPAFAKLLTAVRERQPAPRGRGSFHIMLVSATGNEDGQQPFRHDLQEDLLKAERFRRVYEAEKRLHLEVVANRAAADRRMTQLAKDRSALRTILFIEEPEKARDAAKEIGKAVGEDNVALLTGTLRGKERDQLATHNPVFLDFTRRGLPATHRVLVTTSAGEVGVNLTCERLITGLLESDHLLQRFGRLNRFGDEDNEPHRVGNAHVIFAEDKIEKEAVSATLAYLRQLPPAVEGGKDISCKALREQPPADATRSAMPRMAVLHPWHLDLWAQTTLPDAAVPEVESWLHGQQEGSYPETSLAWRAEVEWLAKEGVDPEERRRAIEACRVLPKEKLKAPTRWIARKFAEIESESLALIVSPNGDVEPKRVDALATSERELRYALVLLPPRVGGLDHGMFSETAPPSDELDIADQADDEAARRRYVFVGSDNEWTRQRLGAESSDGAVAGFDPRDPEELRRFAKAEGLGKATLIEIPGEQDREDAPTTLLVFFSAERTHARIGKSVDLSQHTETAVAYAEKLGKLLYEGPEAEWLRSAAQHHDSGKACDLWQDAMGGDRQCPKAKTVAAKGARRLDGFRHELRSLANAAEGTECDAVLHLVASHHGWARPYFERRAYDQTNASHSERLALEAARRFARLQDRYGHWGLAYLEAVFRAVDGLASAADEKEGK